jgi:putative PEP-CTERM system TPR-repeat lipoprotein
MLRRFNKLKLAAALAGACAMSAGLGGCTGNESTAALLAQARQFQQQGDTGAALVQLKNALENDPADADARYQIATVYNETGEALAAEKEIRRALGFGYPIDAGMPVLAKALMLQGKYQKVLDETDQASVRNGIELLSLRGDASLALDKRTAAKEMYERVLFVRPEYPDALIGMGRLAFVNGDAEAARSYAERVLAADPRNTDALLFEGDLLRAQNQPDKALATYDKVLAVNPGHRSAHIEKAYLEIGIGRFDAAQADLAAARRNAPASLIITYTQALLDYSQGDSAAAQEALQNVLRVAPEHPPSLLLAGAVDLKLGSLNQAEQHLKHYLEKYPNNAYARKMLATTLLRNGKPPSALTVLKPMMKDHAQQDSQLLALAGESYMQVRDFNKATQYFERATVLEPKAAGLRTSLGLSKLGAGNNAQAVRDLREAVKLDATSSKAGMALVRTELGLGHFDDAYSAVLDLEKSQPDNGPVQDLKGMVFLSKQDAKQARAAFEKALRLQPSYFPAASNLAQLDTSEKNPVAARQHLLAFLEQNSGHVDAMTALAALAAAQQNNDEATQWLERASTENPDAIAPAVRLLTHYLLIGQKQKALTLARQVQVSHPDNPDLLDLLGKSQLANGETTNALDSYKRLAAALPRSAQVQMQVAALQILMRNTAAAEDTLKTALAMQPNFPAAQLAQAELQVRKGSYELALLTARQLQRQYPDAAAGYQLEADVLAEQQKAAQALPMYEKAFSFSKSSELLIKTNSALRQNGRAQEAEAQLAQWLRAHPDDTRVKLYKAETLLEAHQYRPAADHLENMLRQHPQNVAVLNNLAWTYQQTKDARAQQMAEEAYKLASDQPVVMDTLGWILVDQGDPARGLALLQKANVHAPAARDIRYHMAMAYFKIGDKASARRELDALMAGNMKFAQADDARALRKLLD